MLFRNEFAFLSNMYRAPFWMNGLYFSCSEAAYQAYKCKDPEMRKRFRGLTGPEAKKLGRKVELRPDWNSVKLDVMYAVVKAKFDEHPELMEALKKVSGKIVEDNTWNDTYWGRCNGVGENHLGKILMEIRDGCKPDDIPFEPSNTPEYAGFKL